MGAITLRRGRLEDAVRAGSICYEAFKVISQRHAFPPDFDSAQDAIAMLSSLLEQPSIYSVVAESDGYLIGSNFLWEGATTAGIGPISVDPEIQDRQIGRLLMNSVLERTRTRGITGVRLVQAGYNTRSLSLYAKLGFVVREPLAVLQGNPPGVEIEGYHVRNAVQHDLDACNRLYCRVHGHERSEDLLGAINRRTATVVEHDGRITGYATLIGYLGHAVGESNEDMKALIGAASRIAGPGLLLPSRNAELFYWCLNQGLRVIQPMTLMSLNAYNEPAGAFLPSVIW